jgi:hypothetical protein
VNNDHAGAEFYDSVLIYSDEILANGKDPSAILNRLNKNFTWKEGKYFPVKERSVGPPDQYLGAETRISIGVNGKKFWMQPLAGMTSSEETWNVGSESTT